MDGLNRVLLLGNLCADPEFRVTSGGQQVLKMRLACSESYLDRNRERKERTEFMNIVIWGKRAEALSRFLSKGARLFVEGSLRTSSYEDRDGNKRYRTEIVAANVILAGRGEGGGRGSGGKSRDEAGPPPDGGGGGGSYEDGDYPDDMGDIPF